MKRLLSRIIILTLLISCSSNENSNETIEFNDGNILISESDGNTTVSENLETDEISISLSEIPQSEVEIIFNILDDTEIEVISNPLVFNQNNWNITQTVAVKGLDDNLVDGNTNTIIEFMVSPNSNASNYENTQNIEITVENIDNDIQYIEGNILISETDGNTIVSENLETDELNISLSEIPQSEVEIIFNILDDTEIEVISNPLVFNQNNWNVTQTVTVKGLDDNLVDGNTNTIIEFMVSPNSNASNYENTQNIEITVENIDNDTQSNLGNILWSSNLNYNLDTYDDVDLIELDNYYYILDEDTDLFKIEKSTGNVVWTKFNVSGINHSDEQFYRAHLFSKDGNIVIIISSSSSKRILNISSSNGTILNLQELNFIVNDVYQLDNGNFFNLNYSSGHIIDELGNTIQDFQFNNFDSNNHTVNDIGTTYAFMENANSYFILDYNVNSSYTNFPRAGYFDINKSNFTLNSSHVYFNSESSRNIYFIKSNESINGNIGLIHQEGSDNYEFSIYSQGTDEIYSKNINKLFNKNIDRNGSNFIIMGKIDASVNDYFPTSYNDKTFLFEISTNGNIIDNKIYDIDMGFRYYKNNFIVDSDGNIVCVTDNNQLIKLEF
jgi:hypothetical protein